MRILHTSDWHLGRTIGGVSRRPDQLAAFEDVVAAGRDFRPDLILHSGDLFDGFRPAVEEMRLAHEMLARLAELAPVVVVAGNHDSGPLFELFESLLATPRMRFVPSIKPPRSGGILDFPLPSGEVARVACLPFLHQNRAVDALEVKAEARTMSYADRIGAINAAFSQELERGYDPTRHVNLLVAHLFVEGATWSRSERPLHVSSSYAARLAAVPPVSYAAFGHIHKPQPLPANLPGRYAGSLVPLDFGEEGETKEVVLVEARPGRAASVKPVPLRGGRALLTLEGTQTELEREDPRDALLRLVVQTQKPTPDLADWATRTFPQATVLEVTERCLAARVELVEEAHEDAFETLDEAFRAYLAENGPEDLVGDELLCLFASLHEEGFRAPELRELEQVLA
ncbi:MAG: exonuclease SbcCD subunit D [Candidatus Eremiobacterota bacterium]